MFSRYEWTLIPYPYFRAFNLFTAFILTSFILGVVTTASMEIREYYVYSQEKKLRQLERENNEVKIPNLGNGDDIYSVGNVFTRALYVGLLSSSVSFITYLLMYFIFGFGGSMISPRRKWRLFSSIRA